MGDTIRIAVCGFGSYWSVQRRPVVYNSTAIATPLGLKPRPLAYGVIRLNAATNFDPHNPHATVGAVFESSGIREEPIRRQLTLIRRIATRAPDAYLVAIRTAEFGTLDRAAQWKGAGIEVISFSEDASIAAQEVLLLMPPYGWIRSSQGMFIMSGAERRLTRVAE